MSLAKVATQCWTLLVVLGPDTSIKSLSETFLASFLRTYLSDWKLHFVGDIGLVSRQSQDFGLQVAFDTFQVIFFGRISWPALPT
jgi:hypothetical protein